MKLINWINEIMRQEFHSEWPSLGEPDALWFIAGWFLIALLLFIAILIIIGVYTAIYQGRDRRSGAWTHLVGNIIDKKYVGPTRTTTTTYAVTAEGAPIPMTDTSTDPEKFLFFVSHGDAITKILVSMAHYYRWEIGQTISFWQLIGGLSHEVLDNKMELSREEYDRWNKINNRGFKD